MNKAEKKKKSFQFFSNSRYEDTAEMYERAGQCFKLSKNCTSALRLCTTCPFASARADLPSHPCRVLTASNHAGGEAGRAFCGASECWLKLGKDNDHEAAEKYIAAGGCFKKVSAPGTWLGRGRFRSDSCD